MNSFLFFPPNDRPAELRPTAKWLQRFCLFLLAASSLIVGCKSAPPNTKELTVAAAADLAPAFTELGQEFEKQSGVKVVFSFGSTGMLAKQIENGAPLDLFAAANVDYVNELEQKGLVVAGSKALYARGRITLWTRSDGGISVEHIQELTRDDIKRIAIANPEHAPYGMAAREALEAVGIWEKVKPKLVYGENVRQTLQYARTGNVEVAIVALSLSVQSSGHWVLIPEDLHQPLDQALAVIKGTQHEQEARSFAAYINSKEGRTVMRKYGFALPGEAGGQ